MVGMPGTENLREKLPFVYVFPHLRHSKSDLSNPRSHRFELEAVAIASSFLSMLIRCRNQMLASFSADPPVLALALAPTIRLVG